MSPSDMGMGMTGGSQRVISGQYVSSNSKKHDTKIFKDVIAIIVLLIIVDIIILIFAIHYILECAKAHNWSPLVTLLLIILLFSPGIGGILSIGIIIYGLSGGCSKPKQLSFSFY